MSRQFNFLFSNLLMREGGFSHDPDDPGGLTILGISQRYHGNSNFYKKIAELLAPPNNTETIEKIFKENYDTIRASAQEFYYENYYVPSHAWAVESLGLSDMIFDTACHRGVREGTRILQIALNVTRRRAEWEALITDGVFGRRTAKVLEEALDRGRHGMILEVMRAVRIMQHIESASKEDGRVKFLFGWLTRDIEVGRPGEEVEDETQKKGEQTEQLE